MKTILFPSHVLPLTPLLLYREIGLILHLQFMYVHISFLPKIQSNAAARLPIGPMPQHFPPPPTPQNRKYKSISERKERKFFFFFFFFFCNHAY